jgi:hypothetical protein
MVLSCTEYFNCMAGQNESFLNLALSTHTHAPLNKYLGDMEIRELKERKISKINVHMHCVDSISDYDRLAFFLLSLHERV